MKGLTGNKYVQAAVVATATGLVAALILGLHLMTQPITTKEFISDVGLAFMGPFATLVTFLPKITDILTPTVRIVSSLPMNRAASLMGEQEVVTSDRETTVAVDVPTLIPTVAARAPREPTRKSPSLPDATR